MNNSFLLALILWALCLVGCTHADSKKDTVASVSVKPEEINPNGPGKSIGDVGRLLTNPDPETGKLLLNKEVADLIWSGKIAYHRESHTWALEVAKDKRAQGITVPALMEFFQKTGHSIPNVVIRPPKERMAGTVLSESEKNGQDLDNQIRAWWEARRR